VKLLSARYLLLNLHLKYHSMNIRLTIILITITLFFATCTTDNNYDKTAASSPDHLHDSLKKLTDVIIHDIFSPPVASRIYAYPSIATYEVLRQENLNYQSFAGQLNELPPTPLPDENQEYCFPLAGVHAFLAVSKAMIFSEEKIEAFTQEIHDAYREAGIPKRTFRNSLEYGEKVAQHILLWADKDNYKQTRTFPKFAINDKEARWQPTPPAYMESIEPHWRKIRPFLLDSATQFVPLPPSPFDLSVGSTFRNEVMEVYETVKNLTPEQTEIASFWDCNPYVQHQTGHVMFATKKITPGGHWMGIASIAVKSTEKDIMQSAATYACTAIALADAFISCWDEKYRSNLIRPETVINQHIDETWTPLLQTPPFPEYTSGHSVISTAAATVLTHLHGENFAFEDYVEVEYGLPKRNFSSFEKAAEEAAISRLYGGIHYMPAITQGVEQGKKVGDFVVENLSVVDGL